MSFMSVETFHGKMMQFDGRNGIDIVPLDVADITRDALMRESKGFPIEESVISGWFARYSAPGYLDCTDWDGPHKSEDAAIESVKSQYGDDDESDDETDSDDDGAKSGE